MAKVSNPLFSEEASGQFGHEMIFRRGGVVTRIFKPRNPNTIAQQLQRQAFKEFSLPGLTQAQADLLYAAIIHRHDDLYSLLTHGHVHGALSGLADDDHSQYLNQTRGDARYLQSVPQQDHGGLAGLGDDDHTQYWNQTRGDAAVRAYIAKKNIVINGGFTINQRGYVSAATLAAGGFGHDRWKAGAGGGNYSFTQLASPTIITIAANKTLIQVIENKMVLGGNYILSWSGTCQARYAINSVTPAGAYALSPIIISGQTAGTTMSIEFGNGASSGTLGSVQLELSAYATAFEFRPYTSELLLCLPYGRKVRPTTLVANGTAIVWGGISLFPPMRATPTVTQPVVLGITDVVSANFTQSSALINGTAGSYLGADFLFVNYGNFTGLTSGRLYYVQPAVSDASTFVSAEL